MLYKHKKYLYYEQSKYEDEHIFYCSLKNNTNSLICIKPDEIKND